LKHPCRHGAVRAVRVDAPDLVSTIRSHRSQRVAVTSPAPGTGQYGPFTDGGIKLVRTPLVPLDGLEFAYWWHLVGTHLCPIDAPGFAHTGQQMVVEETSVLHSRDGRVDHVRLFSDTTHLARPLLAAPPSGSPLERVIALSQRARVRLRRRTRGR
jgi:hypothetical protein